MKQTDSVDRARSISVVITDVDGVLTDGGMYYGESGEELKKFNIRDGAGIALLKAAGIRVGAMTGERRELVTRRLKKIGVDYYFEGIRNKLARFEAFLEETGIGACDVAFIGDEINDYCLLGVVGIFFAVADACPEVRARADHVLNCRGGEGALREVAGILLDAQGKADVAMQAYLESGRGHTEQEDR